MAATDQPRRRFITRSHVQDAAESGRSLSLGPRDVLTDEGAQRARDLGVEVVREGGRRPSSAPPGSTSRVAPPGPTSGSPASTDDALRSAVRAAVVAELGAGAPGVDAAIDRVFARRRTKA